MVGLLIFPTQPKVEFHDCENIKLQLIANPAYDGDCLGGKLGNDTESEDLLLKTRKKNKNGF